jgi:hypothetical protein
VCGINDPRHTCDEYVVLLVKSGMTPTDGRCSCNGHLLCSSLHDQNPQHVLTIPGGSASAVELMVRTTPPNVDKEDTSSAEAPMTWALVARPGSKALDDNPADDDPDLLNFYAVESWIAWQTSSPL